MDAPQEFDENAMKERVAKMMSKPGITFSDLRRAEINALVEAGDTEDAQRIILDVLTQAFGGGSKEGE